MSKIPPCPEGAPVVLFDLDGTLVDTETVAIEVTAKYFADFGQTVPHAALAYLVGRPWLTGLDYLNRHYPIGKISAEVETEVLAGYRKALATYLPQIRGSREAVLSLSSHFRLGLVSNSRREDIHNILGLMGLGDHFSLVVGYEDVARGKPAPDPYLKAITQFAMEPSCMLVFEDSVSGINAAQSAGLSVVTVGNHPDAIAGRPKTRWDIVDFLAVDAEWVRERLSENGCRA